ncbi:hypothetical protein OSH68_22630, partial [Mycobacterium ulcerans]
AGFTDGATGAGGDGGQGGTAASGPGEAMVVKELTGASLVRHRMAARAVTAEVGARAGLAVKAA